MPILLTLAGVIVVGLVTVTAFRVWWAVLVLPATEFTVGVIGECGERPGVLSSGSTG